VRVYRATDTGGRYAETIPIGANAAGRYVVRVTSPVENLTAEVACIVGPSGPAPEPLAHEVRVFDGEAIAEFLAAKPSLVIAVGSDEQRPTAERLAAGLRAKGIAAKVVPEDKVWRKALYPRVWDPTITVHRPTGKPIDPAGRDMKREATIETTGYNTHRVLDAEGKPLEGDWRQPGTLLTVVGKGCVIEERGRLDAYEPGCKLYTLEQRKLEVLGAEAHQTETTPEVRRRWARPWARLESFVGAWHLVPQLPEAYEVDDHLILLGDSTTGELVRALQASELLPQVVDRQYPGPGKALVAFAWSPFRLEKDVVFVGAADGAGLEAGVAKLFKLAARGP
jgi:hypothetical protein